MKPTLKKVSKYENKFAKLQKKAAEFNFRNQLKQVKKKEFTLEEEDKEVRTTVFDRIFASKRREYFFRKIVFSLPVKGLFQVFFEFIRKNFCRDTSWEISCFFLHLCISKYNASIFILNSFIICLLYILYFCEFLILTDKFTSTVFLSFAMDVTFYSRTTGGRVV